MNYDSLYLNPFQYIYVTPLVFMENKTKKFYKLHSNKWLIIIWALRSMIGSNIDFQALLFFL